MTLIIVGGVVGFILLLAFVPKMIEESRIMSKAREDYLRCRGTHHARQLQSAIKRHEDSLRLLHRRRDEIASELRTMNQQTDAELLRALTIHLINTRFTEIPGIGTKLKDRIVRTCFDGTLESLLRSQRAHGVGQEKAAAIRSWVYRMKQTLPKLLDKDFPGKPDIIEKQRAKREQLSEQRDDLTKAVSSRERVIADARKGLVALEAVAVSDFREALRGDHKASEKIAHYAVGSFAEWERMPRWFAAILAEPGEE